MAKLANEIEINPWRPSVQETVEHNRHTQVGVPLARARAVAWVRFGGVLGDVLIVGCVLAALFYLWAGPQWVGFALLGAACVLGALAWAFGPPMAEFVDAQMKDLRDPFRDSEWRAVQEARQAQPAAAPPPTVRVESVVREPGRTTLRTAYNDDLPGTSEQWCSLAGVVLRNVAPEAFALRTAESVGLSRDQWNAARDIFVRRGWAGWNHPHDRRQGVTLRLVGRRALREMLTQLETTPYELTPME